MSPRKALTGAELSKRCWRAKDLPWNTDGRRIASLRRPELGHWARAGSLHLCELRVTSVLLYVKGRALAPTGTSDQPSSSQGKPTDASKALCRLKLLVFKRRCSV